MTSVRRRILLYGLYCLGVLMVCGVAGARALPQQDTNQAAAVRQPRADSDQEKSRVAAPVEQIRAVLVKDPGLLVELERIVEKEAIAKGQVVEDTDLTEQAIFDRLDDDATFRSTATRLLQRYGYLLPNVNPDSAIGKEQELVLKERARRMVQIEEHEDTESLQPRKPQDETPSLTSAANANCDSRNDTSCVKPGERRQEGDQANPADEPSGIPTAPPNLNPGRQTNGSPIIQTRYSGGNSLPEPNDGGDSHDLLREAAMNASRDPSSVSFSQDDLQRYLSRAGNKANLGDDISRSESVAYGASENNVSISPSSIRSYKPKSDNGDSQQGAIVRKPNPYSDVPSLVDLYVQVSNRNKPLDRFGVDILTSTSHGSNAIAMDLPVGPDYVVGPGDGLAIDLWGGVSQRLQRTVDHEGRILLPEYGPILVSGKTLGDVQLTIQQLLRTQLRDISTDVSLSRLRTVRVYVVGEVAAPGAYDLSSLSSPLNALVAAGGPTEHGSLRAIKHYRGKQLLEVVDAYE
jgi:hypothetical protein